MPTSRSMPARVRFANCCISPTGHLDPSVGGEPGRPMTHLGDDDANVRVGSCVTSIAGPNGDAQLYER